MKQRPILFSTSMVQAILAGQKTQTRRMVKPYCGDLVHMGIDLQTGKHTWIDASGRYYTCPYGHAFDELWVRETWRMWQSGEVIYKADHTDEKRSIWKPSIHMPRSASRISLELTKVHAERVQWITEADCLAEGIQRCTKDGELYKYGWDGLPWTDWKLNGKAAYRALWESINGPKSWAGNPWVWVLTFERKLSATQRMQILDEVLTETNQQTE